MEENVNNIIQHDIHKGVDPDNTIQPINKKRRIKTTLHIIKKDMIQITCNNS